MRRWLRVVKYFQMWRRVRMRKMVMAMAAPAREGM
jgi:hypothetical protein